MANMSHCMCHNTREDLDQVIQDIDLNDLSDPEMKESLALLEACAKFINYHGRDILDIAGDQGTSTKRTIRSLLKAYIRG